MPRWGQGCLVGGRRWDWQVWLPVRAVCVRPASAWTAPLRPCWRDTARAAPGPGGGAGAVCGPAWARCLGAVFSVAAMLWPGVTPRAVALWLGEVPAQKARGGGEENLSLPSPPPLRAARGAPSCQGCSDHPRLPLLGVGWPQFHVPQPGHPLPPVCPRPLQCGCCRRRVWPCPLPLPAGPPPPPPGPASLGPGSGAHVIAASPAGRRPLLSPAGHIWNALPGCRGRGSSWWERKGPLPGVSHSLRLPGAAPSRRSSGLRAGLAGPGAGEGQGGSGALSPAPVGLALVWGRWGWRHRLATWASCFHRQSLATRGCQGHGRAA